MREDAFRNSQYKMQTLDWVQNADREQNSFSSKTWYISIYNLHVPFVTQLTFRSYLPRYSVKFIFSGNVVGSFQEIYFLNELTNKFVHKHHFKPTQSFHFRMWQHGKQHQIVHCDMTRLQVAWQAICLILVVFIWRPRNFVTWTLKIYQKKGTVLLSISLSAFSLQNERLY